MINHPRPEDSSGVKEYILFMCALYFKMNFVSNKKKFKNELKKKKFRNEFQSHKLEHCLNDR